MKAKKGSLLVANLDVLGDANFSRSVILLAENKPKSNLGIILNKKTPFTVQKFIPGFNTPFPIYSGGPCHENALYFLHSVPQFLGNKNHIADGIYLGNDLDFAKNNINKKLVSFADVRFFTGYAGWDLNQLNQEITDGSWLIMENTSKHKLLRSDNLNLWSEKMFEYGGKYALYLNAPDDPNLN